MRFRKTIIAAVLVGVTGGVVAAQSETPSNPNILAAVQSLRADLTAALTSLFQTLTSIQNTLNALVPPAQTNVKVTPAMIFPAGSSNELHCSAINLASSNREIQIQVRSGAAVLVSGGLTLLPEGSGTFGSIAVPSGAFYCKFTVVNGVASDISVAAIQIINNSVAAVIGPNP